MKVVRLSALRTSRPNPQEIFLVLIYVRGRVDPRAARMMSMKNSSDTNGNGTRDCPTCSAVPQPTAPPANVGGLNVYIIRVNTAFTNPVCLETGNCFVQRVSEYT
jgi:hypothetical protein